MSHDAAHWLNPWFGEGGHLDCPPGGNFAHGRVHDYRVLRAKDPETGAVTFSAEQRLLKFGEWVEISRGHATAYLACDACGRSEHPAVAATASSAVVSVGETKTGSTGFMSAPSATTEKPSGLERLRQAREASRKKS